MTILPEIDTNLTFNEFLGIASKCLNRIKENNVTFFHIQDSA